MNQIGHRLIIEGVELAGKSSITHQIYDFLEKKYNTSGHILDGCHWINADINVFGTELGKDMINLYIKMGELLHSCGKNVIFEKFHISDQAYNLFHNNKIIDYEREEERLMKLDTKIILCTVNPDPEIFKSRLEDRLSHPGYFHYHRLAKEPTDYIDLQEKYIELCEKSKLPVLMVDLSVLPNHEVVKEILSWLGETN